MTLTILITSCVCAVFFTILNQFEQKHYLALQEQRDELLAVCEDVALVIDAYCDDHASESPTDVTVVLPNLLSAIAKAGGAK